MSSSSDPLRNRTRGHTWPAANGNSLPRLRGRVGVGIYRRPRSERFGNDLEYAGAVFENLVVPESENTPALSSQRGVSAVVLAGVTMLAAIRFDDYAGFDAREIGEIGRYLQLATKAPAETGAAWVPP